MGPLYRTGCWADADMLPLGHIGIRAERGIDRQITAHPRRADHPHDLMGDQPLAAYVWRRFAQQRRLYLEFGSPTMKFYGLIKLVVKVGN